MEVGGQWVAISGSKLEEGGWISLSDRLDATNNFGSLVQRDQLPRASYLQINPFRPLQLRTTPQSYPKNATI